MILFVYLIQSILKILFINYYLLFMKKNKSARLAAKAAASEKEIETAPVAGEVKKTKKVSTEKVDKINATTTVAKITEKKELKYKYPAECEEGEDKVALLELRKKFRAGVRRKLASYEKKIKALRKSNLEEDLVLMGKLEKEITKYRKSVLANPTPVE